jgi:RNA-directed DNA polymerase
MRLTPTDLRATTCARQRTPRRASRDGLRILAVFSMTIRRSDPLLNLARALLAGPWRPAALRNRAQRACPMDDPSIRAIVRRLCRKFPGQVPPPFDALLLALSTDRRLDPAVVLRIGEYFWLPDAMAPRVPATQSWNVPAITSAGQLAAWLGIPLTQLDWFADVRGLTIRQPSPQLRHYLYRWQPRRRGHFRLIESPKPKLKAIQRRILHELLDTIPPHPAVHGFRSGRSILTYAAPHAGRRIVLRFDLRDSFPAVWPARVHALFRTAGYPHQVARLLTGLCTSRVPPDAWDQRPDPRAGDASLGNCLLARHLPQGAPTSPALANLCCRRLDSRLHGLARSVQASYTRYADDLAFSGGVLLERSARRFQVAVAVIAAEEGFELHFQKSRFMRRGVCQQLAGVVLNEHPNLRRAAYDELKAILTNCVRHGPATQNRAGHADFRAHLLGRIAHVRMIHPHHADKLRAIFERIAW